MSVHQKHRAQNGVPGSPSQYRDSTITGVLKRTAGTATVTAGVALYLLSGSPLPATPLVPVEAQLPSVNIGELVQILRHRSRTKVPEGLPEELPTGDLTPQFRAVQETSSWGVTNMEPPAFRVASDNNSMSSTSQSNLIEIAPPPTSVHAEEPLQVTRADFPDFQPISSAEANERAMALLTKADLAHEKYLREEARHSSLGSDLA